MILNKVLPAKNFLKKFGLKIFLYRFLNYIFKIPDPINLKKQKILNNLLKKYDSKVQYGPFKNMVLNKQSWWSKYDLISQVLGTYEENILNYILSKRDQAKELFVDIGAADGYFVIGLARINLFKNIYAYEISREARKEIKNNAIINNCLNKLDIRQEASLEEFKEIERKFNSGIILIDIEGCEYDLLTDEALYILRKFHLIIEMHPFLIKDGLSKSERLFCDARKYFAVDKSIRLNYSPAKFEELSSYTEDEQLLALSEGRSETTEWILLSPKT